MEKYMDCVHNNNINNNNNDNDDDNDGLTFNELSAPAVIIVGWLGRKATEPIAPSWQSFRTC
jgi:hypothetical protein